MKSWAKRSFKSDHVSGSGLPKGKNTTGLVTPPQSPGENLTNGRKISNVELPPKETSDKPANEETIPNGEDVTVAETSTVSNCDI